MHMEESHKKKRDSKNKMCNIYIGGIKYAKKIS